MHPSYIPEYPRSKFLIELAHSRTPTGIPRSISAILTVNSSVPLTNSFVPSSGSTSQKRCQSRRTS